MKRILTLFAMLFAITAVNAQTQPTDTDGDGYYNISTLDHLRYVSENNS